MFSCGLEILEDVPEVDVVVVCCETGALVAGIAAGIKLIGRKDCRVYDVEPTGGDCGETTSDRWIPITRNQ